jgi:hypothetical protein
MARFYGELKGARGRASRLGTASSGMSAHIRGWDVGVRVQLSMGPDGNDLVQIWATGGSNGLTNERLIAELTLASNGERLYRLCGFDGTTWAVEKKEAQQ